MTAGRPGPDLLVATVSGLYPPALPVQLGEPVRIPRDDVGWDVGGKHVVGGPVSLDDVITTLLTGLHFPGVSRALLAGRMISVNPSTHLGEDDIMVCQDTWVLHPA